MKLTGDHPDDDKNHDNNVVDDVEPELAEAASHLVATGRIVLQAPNEIICKTSERIRFSWIRFCPK